MMPYASIAFGVLLLLSCATAERGGRTTVTVQAASAATLAETLPKNVRIIEFCRAPMTIWST